MILSSKTPTNGRDQGRIIAVKRGDNMATEQMKQKFEESKAERWGCRGINPVFCRTCIFAHGEPPFADSPEKAYCRIYERDKGTSKPPEVYYDGERCEFYEQEKRRK